MYIAQKWMVAFFKKDILDKSRCFHLFHFSYVYFADIGLFFMVGCASSHDDQGPRSVASLRHFLEETFVVFFSFV